MRQADSGDIFILAVILAVGFIIVILLMAVDTTEILKAPQHPCTEVSK